MITLPEFLDGTATCATHPDPDLWHSADHTEAARLCHTCPLLAACRDYALTAGEQHGVWGGLTPRDRRRLRRTPLPCGTPEALTAHLRWDEDCRVCRDAQAARTTADRRTRLATEHAAGGTPTGAAIHRRLGEDPCVHCRAAVARQSREQRARRQNTPPADREQQHMAIAS